MVVVLVEFLNYSRCRCIPWSVLSQCDKITTKQEEAGQKEHSNKDGGITLRMSMLGRLMVNNRNCHKIQPKVKDADSQG